ncbi:MAG: hypothetical protein ACLSVG_02735 [Clostridia bacterium]
MAKETNQIYLSSCPVCGRTLFKGTPDSCIEGGCQKCKEYLKIKFHDTGYQVCIIKPDEEITTAKCAVSKIKTR